MTFDWPLVVNQAKSGGSRDFQSQLVVSQVAATLVPSPQNAFLTKLSELGLNYHKLFIVNLLYKFELRV